MMNETSLSITKLAGTEKIQLYKGVKDNRGSEIDIADVLKQIAGKHLEKQTAALRKSIEELTSLKSQVVAEKNKDEWQKLVTRYEAIIAKEKNNLPGVTWSGTFALATAIKKEEIKNFLVGKLSWKMIGKDKSKYHERTRAIDQIKDYNNLVVLDIDKLSKKEFTKVRKAVCKDPFTHICFTSPSGNGIKFIIKVEGTADKIKGYFLSIEKYYLAKYNVKIDASGKDVSRLCFLCQDVNLYVNNDCKIYTNFIVEKIEPVKPFTKKEAIEFEASSTTQDVFVFTEKKISYTEGNRNRFLNLFCNNCNRKGISMSDCSNYCFANMPDRDKAEIIQTVENAYNNNVNEHGKYAKKNKTAALNKTIPATNGQTHHSEEFTQFWSERENTRNKGKDDEYTYTLFALKRVEFTDFLYEQGFHLLDTDAKETTGYQICHSANGIIEPVDSRIIKKHVFAWCKKFVARDVEEMLRKGQKQFFANNEMDSLHTKNIEFKTDTETESYFYFKNCWVAVSAENISTYSYTDLKEFIWAGNKKEHEFKVQQPKFFTEERQPVLSPAAMNCEFAKFIYLCGYNPDNIDEKDFGSEIIQQRFECLCSAIGFLLDGYKHPANRKSIFALDHKIGERGEQHGRTGKSIIPKACQHLKVVSHINGKSYDPKYQFRNEPITADAQIIDFNDMTRTFDPEHIFEIIADDYSVNRRNNGFLHFKYENSPKVYYSTNAIPKGEGGSYTGRMHLIEFSDYFTPTHTPYDEFGHGMLSSAWNEVEWNHFYNFMLWCVQLYKSMGLVTYPASNFDARKMASEVNAEFVDFMDSDDQFPRDIRTEKLKVLEKFNVIYLSLYSKKLQPHTFHKWVKQYCKNNNLYFNPHRSGSFDKANGIEYYTIATTPGFKTE